MFDRRKLYGAALGVLLALPILARVSATAPARPVHGALPADCDGAFRELVIHYTPQAAEIVDTVYKDFLRQLPPDVKVSVLCPTREAFDTLAAQAAPLQCKLAPVVVSHAITCWSRDRWLALTPRDTGPVTLLAPRGEAGAPVWAERAGDQRVHEDLALAQPGKITAHRSLLYFDGGDFVADGETAFVTPAVLRRNLQHTVASREELLAQLRQKIEQRIVLFSEAPDHHACMYMMPVGERTVVVGDPSLARRTLDISGSADDVICGSCGPDFTPATQRLFDAVAAQCEAAGYRAVRMPVVPGRDGRTYLTYLNVMIDQPASSKNDPKSSRARRTVYMPTYSHVPELNAAASEVWRSLNFEIRPVNCTAAYTHFGSLRCLVNVVRRDNSKSTVRE